MEGSKRCLKEYLPKVHLTHIESFQIHDSGEFPLLRSSNTQPICALLSILLKVHVPFCVSFLDRIFLPFFLVGFFCICVCLFLRHIYLTYLASLQI